MSERRALRALRWWVAVTAFAVHPVLAERADREKPVNIESTRLTADDAKQVAVFEERVVVTQGTFQLKADRLTVRQDKAGNQFAVATGKPATFRTKRDGVDEWIEGEAERIEYDSVSERIELFIRAKVYRDKDILRGNYILYDQKTESLTAQDSKDGATRPVNAPSPRAGDCPPGRVCTTIHQKPKPAAPGAGASNLGNTGNTSGGVELRPTQSLGNPR
jgi:lipopolysaccharide export system protein LptA